jgi:hypothetical protein
MTRKQNLLNMLAGRKPEWVPCSLNLWQWHKHHKTFGTLPEELMGTESDLDAMKVLGLDFFTRNVPCQRMECFEGLEVETESIRQPLGMQTTRILRTPHGDLRQVSQEQAAMTTAHEMEHFVHDWETQGRAYLYALERLRMTWDRELFARTLAEVGDHGLIMMPVGETPLKRLHMDFGLEYASMFMMLHPEAAKTCCDAYWAHLWPMLCDVVEADGLHAVVLMDNVDTPFYPPNLCGQYWTPYVRQAAELFERKGKRLLVHACGKLRGLRDVLKASGVHGLEGIAHPPLGDFIPAEAWDLGDRFIYNGGFSAHEQVSKTDDELRTFYDGFFRDLEGFPRLIFAASCNTAVNTPWERIKLAVALCRERGGAPRDAAGAGVRTVHSSLSARAS